MEGRQLQVKEYGMDRLVPGAYNLWTDLYHTETRILRFAKDDFFEFIAQCLNVFTEQKSIANMNYDSNEQQCSKQ